MLMRVGSLSPEQIRLVEKIELMLLDQDTDFVTSLALPLFVNSILVSAGDDVDDAHAGIDAFHRYAKDAYNAIIGGSVNLNAH